MDEALLTAYTIGRSARDCRLALKALCQQTIHDALEVILVTTDCSGLDPACLERFARFRCLEVPSVSDSGSAMAAAVHAAQTPFVVYTEEHQWLDPRWAEVLVEAHTVGHDIVGCAMENANPGWISWTHLYGQFGPAVAPVRSGPVPMLTGHHVSYRRSVLLEYGDLLSAVLEDESALFLDQRVRGRQLFMAGDAIAYHANISRLSALMRLDYLGQRTFASTRAQVGGWSLGRRLAYAAAAPLVPPLRIVRALRHVRRTGRGSEMLPMLLAPMICMTVAGAGGECLGYLLGRGRAANQRLSFELERQRYLGAGDNWDRDAAGPANRVTSAGVGE